MASYKSKKSDSGFGDDAASGSTQPTDLTPDHPLAKKGYEIGTAARLEVGDVFEFLWADSNEFEWEWKCLGYVRFIVLRHSDTFPHHAVCIPISVGSKHNFAKPGIDSSQQGFIFDDNSPDQWHEKLSERHRLYYPPVGIELARGKFRVKEDSRANYADIIEIDHDAQVMVIGTVARYFDRLRRSVNKAVMRNILKRALTEYKTKRDKQNASPPKIEPSVVGAGAPLEDDDQEDEEEEEVDPSVDETNYAMATAAMPMDIPTPREQRSIRSIRSSAEERRAERRAPSSAGRLPTSRGNRKTAAEEASEQLQGKHDPNRASTGGQSDYDLRSLHSVAMKGINY
ncbi:hypothetical protein G7054_g11568 [Neopestalotiopsis clavispora]|nr:hypothetical protein E8E14_014842 [Neopestalotiopsis sp. 37M]KAF7524017.1 hypothetical protein G7054_g11568 [Neopestalotiopsis clavispora]